MVLKKFQVCAKCCFLSRATRSAGDTFQPQSQLFTFESISYIPTCSFLTSTDTASGHACTNAKIDETYTNSVKWVFRYKHITYSIIHFVYSIRTLSIIFNLITYQLK